MLLLKFSNKLALKVASWKLLQKSLFLLVWQASTEHCLKILMDSDWPYQS